MKKAYVVGPYRADTEYGVKQNIQAAEKVAVELWKMGYAVFCPHLNTAHFGGACPDEVWLQGDLEWLRVSDVVVLTPGWEDSKGSLGELKEALSLSKKVFVWDATNKTLLPFIPYKGLKVGDKVKVNDYYPENLVDQAFNLRGHVGTVIEVRTDAICWPYKVQFPNVTQLFTAKELDKVES